MRSGSKSVSNERCEAKGETSAGVRSRRSTHYRYTTIARVWPPSFGLGRRDLDKFEAEGGKIPTPEKELVSRELMYKCGSTPGH